MQLERKNAKVMIAWKTNIVRQKVRDTLRQTYFPVAVVFLTFFSLILSLWRKIEDLEKHKSS